MDGAGGDNVTPAALFQHDENKRFGGEQQDFRNIHRGLSGAGWSRQGKQTTSQGINGVKLWSSQPTQELSSPVIPEKGSKSLSPAGNF